MKYREHEEEAYPGLPEELPEGERVLWQGQPDWRALALQAFKVRWVAVYFAALVAIRLALWVGQGAPMDGLLSVAAMVGAFALAFAMFLWGARLHAQSTLYTLTNRRLVMRIGVALTTSWNLPFARLQSAGVAVGEDGVGDIVLDLKAPDRVAYLVFWPNVRPGNPLTSGPALRCIPDAERVSGLLGQAVREWAAERDGETSLTVRADDDDPRPARDGLQLGLTAGASS